jgi:hypothetical protein
MDFTSVMGTLLLTTDCEQLSPAYSSIEQREGASTCRRRLTTPPPVAHHIICSFVEDGKQ